MSTTRGNGIFTGVGFMYTVHTIRDAVLEHDPEKWETVSRFREARFGGRSKVGKDHAPAKSLGQETPWHR